MWYFSFLNVMKPLQFGAPPASIKGLVPICSGRVSPPPSVHVGIPLARLRTNPYSLSPAGAG